MAEFFFGLTRCEMETKYFRGILSKHFYELQTSFLFFAKCNENRIQVSPSVLFVDEYLPWGKGQYLGTLHQQIATMVVLTSHCQGCLLLPPWCCYMQHSWTSALKLLKEADILFCLYQNLVTIQIREKKVNS